MDLHGAVMPGAGKSRVKFPGRHCIGGPAVNFKKEVSFPQSGLRGRRLVENIVDPVRPSAYSIRPDSARIERCTVSVVRVWLQDQLAVGEIEY